MISNIWNNFNSNKNLLIRDISDKSIINDIIDDNSLDDDLKESLINDTFKHSMKCKILEKNINNKRSLKKEPTINKIISHSMNNNFKKSLINEKIYHLSKIFKKRAYN